MSFPRLGLVAELHHEPDFLHVRSTIDTRQGYLLPLRPERLCGGLSLFTRVGGLHALFWALAYGAGPLEVSDVIHFATADLRHRTTTSVEPRPVGQHHWVAAAPGSYAWAAFERDGVQLASGRISDRW